jgi:hypothetical protein
VTIRSFCSVRARTDHTGLIEIEPRPELALIGCAGLLLWYTVTVEVPTNVSVRSR